MDCRREIFSPQGLTAWRRRLTRLSKQQLLALKAEIEQMLNSRTFDPELEIAWTHTDSDLVQQTISDRGYRKLQTILCSKARCERCPHGPFWFTYRASRTGMKIRFVGVPFLPPDLIKKMGDEVRPPGMVYSIKLRSD